MNIPLLTLSLTFLAIYMVASIIRKWSRIKDIKRRRREKLLQKKHSIEMAWNGKGLNQFQLAENVEKELLGADACKCLEMLEKGEVSSVDLVNYYSRRAILIDKKHTVITELLYEEAIGLAEEADKLRKNDPQAKNEKILLGLPFSVKDCLDQKNCDSTLGLSTLCMEPKKNDSVLIKIMRNQGAIPFVRTNVPQLLMIPETVNFIFGRTTNPFSKDRTSGGSSGGEGTLIAEGGAPFGIGTDIGGSIRLPASFVGVYGFKPYSKRVCNIFREAPVKSQKSCFLLPTSGPLCRTTRDLNLYMKAVLTPNAFDLDPRIPKMPWNENILTKNKKEVFGNDAPKIGVLKECDLFELCPTGKRALEESRKAAELAGYETVEFEVPFFERLVELYLNYGAGNIEKTLSLRKGEPMPEEYSLIQMSIRIPGIIKSILSGVNNILGKKRMGFVLRNRNLRTLDDFWEHVNEHWELRDEFYKLMREKGVDGLLVPMPMPAYLNGTSKHLFISCIYTFVFNLIECSCIVFPVTKVRNDECYYESKAYNDVFTKKAKENLKNAEGMPVGCQVVTYPYREEKNLRIVQDITEKLKEVQAHL